MQVRIYIERGLISLHHSRGLEISLKDRRAAPDPFPLFSSAIASSPSIEKNACMDTVAQLAAKKKLRNETNNENACRDF